MSTALETADIQIGTPEETEPCHQKLTITIPAALVDSTIAKIEKVTLSKAKLPGFRPGKTPMSMIRRRFAGAITDEVRNELMNAAFRKALDSEAMKPLTMPTIFGTENEEEPAEITPVAGEDLTITLEYDVAPTFELPTYKGLALTKPASTVGDEQVDEFLNNFRRQRATVTVVERPAAAEDILRVSYTSELELPEGEEVPEVAKRLVEATEQWVMLQEPEIIPGVIAGLTGASKGENVTMDVTFPEDYHEPFLAGKSATYTFTIIEINAHVLPEVDDEFAKGLGLETAEELRGMVRERLTGEAERSRTVAMHAQLQEKLLEGADFPLPPRVFAREKHNVYHELHQRHHQQHTDDTDHEHNHPELTTDAEEQATTRLRFQYIIERIAETEEIDVSDEDVAQSMDYLRESRGMTQAKFEQSVNVDALASNVRWDMLRNLTLDRLVDLAEVTEEAPSTDAAAATETEDAVSGDEAAAE